MVFVYLKLFPRPCYDQFECVENWLEKRGKSDDFSKLMKDRNSEAFENGLKAVNTLAQLQEKFDHSTRKGNLGPMARF